MGISIVIPPNGVGNELGKNAINVGKGAVLHVEHNVCEVSRKILKNGDIAEFTTMGESKKTASVAIMHKPVEHTFNRDLNGNVTSQSVKNANGDEFTSFYKKDPNAQSSTIEKKTKDGIGIEKTVVETKLPDLGQFFRDGKDTLSSEDKQKLALKTITKYDNSGKLKVETTYLGKKIIKETAPNKKGYLIEKNFDYKDRSILRKICNYPEGTSEEMLYIQDEATKQFVPRQIDVKNKDGKVYTSLKLTQKEDGSFSLVKDAYYDHDTDTLANEYVTEINPEKPDTCIQEERYYDPDDTSKPYHSEKSIVSNPDPKTLKALKYGVFTDY